MNPHRTPLIVRCAGCECFSDGDAIFVGAGQVMDKYLFIPGLPTKAVGFRFIIGRWYLRVMNPAVSVEGVDSKQPLPDGISRLVLHYGSLRMPVEVRVGQCQAILRPPPRRHGLPISQVVMSRPDALQRLLPAVTAEKSAVLPTEDSIIVGSAPDCNLRLLDPTVEAHHAQLSRTAVGRWTIRRMDAGALIWLDGEPIIRGGLREGSWVTFGGRSLLWPNDFVKTTAAVLASSTITRTSRGSMPEALGLSRAVPAAELSRAVIGFAGTERPHLGPVNQIIEAGKVYAIIGPSGAGKSTLCHALLGEAQLREGSIKIAGNSVQKNLSPNPMHFGFVPQANILIPQLTVGETLEFAARVRLANNVTPRERTELVARLVQQLEIGHTMKQKVSSLSGGEKRRVSIAQELLIKPNLLLLDEPTSGLDEGLDRVFMRLIRDLSRDDAKPGVVVVTHATQNLSEADGVIAIGSSRRNDGPVSKVRYSGSPQQLLSGNGKSEFADLMDSLRGDREKPRDTRISRTEHRFVSRPSFNQLRALGWRDCKVEAGDRSKQVWTSLGWAVSIAFLIRIINTDTLRVDGPGSNPLLLVSISLIVILSSLSALYLPIADIVSRLPVAHREQRWGVSIRLAIFARVLRDSVKVIVQMLLTAVLVLAATWLMTEGAGKPTMAEQLWIIGILVANGLACYAIGVLIGTTSMNESSAMRKMMAVVAAMIVLSGVMFHLPDTLALDMISRIVPPRVAIADIASVLVLGDTIPRSVPNGPKLDPFMDLSAHWYGLLVAQLFATYAVCIFLAVAFSHRTLRRFEALR